MIWTTTLTQPLPSTADLVWPTLGRMFGGDPPVRLRTWDGSEVGPPDRPTLILRDKNALRRLLWQPGELGLARAYVTGELDVDGDFTECLRLVWQAARDHGLTGGRISPGHWANTVRAALRLGVAGPPPKPPASEVRSSARPHSGRHDHAAVGQQHQLRPEFCQLILGPQLACSAALWASGCSNLADAQAAALDVICAKLGLQAGMRLLDVGCGWGALAIRAAHRYGARVTAVTRSGEQAAIAERRVAELGLQSHVTVRAGEHREISVPPQDAIVIEMGEHIGGSDLTASCDQLRNQLRPGGRLLIEQLSHPEPTAGCGPFVDRYIAPDLHLRTVSETISALRQAGFEIGGVSSMSHDYSTTVHVWQQNLERHFSDAIAMAGPESARVWRLGLASVALALEAGRLDVHQVGAALRPATRAAAPRAATRTAGARTAGTHAARTRTTRAAGTHAASTRTAGARAVGMHAASARPR